MLLPTVDFCGLRVTRLILGANPFGGFSHQGPERNREMLDYYTPERIIETLHRAEAAGINTFITNNSPEMLAVVRQYFADGGALQWIAQINDRYLGSMIAAADEAADLGALAIYLHGREAEQMCFSKNPEKLAESLDRIRSHGLPAGVAAHGPEIHQWVLELGIVDFHAHAFFRCGSLHDGQGLKFKLSDMPAAVEWIRNTPKPCIGYKIMAAGRIDPTMAFEYAFDRIKATDVVNVGMHRGDKDDMVEENVALVRRILACGDGGDA